MTPELRRDLLAALGRSHRLGTIGGDLEEQLAHCVSFSSVLGRVLARRGSRAPIRAGDLGTGGGLPGVVLACLWPEMHWTLVEMRAARATEVERVVLDLGLANRVDVVVAEAQHLAHQPEFRESFSIVVARAFGPPSLTAECASGLVAVGGDVVISEPPAERAEEGRWPADAVQALGLRGPEFVQENGNRFAIFQKDVAAPPSVPRLPPRPGRNWFRSS